MSIIDDLVEQKIKASRERGDFDNLSGQGKPLQLEDDSFVPAELRTGYRMLKNAGFLPPELERRKDIQEAEALLCHVEDNAERLRLVRKISLLKAQLAKHRQQLSAGLQEQVYREKLLAKVTD